MLNASNFFPAGLCTVQDPKTSRLVLKSSFPVLLPSSMSNQGEWNAQGRNPSSVKDRKHQQNRKSLSTASYKIASRVRDPQTVRNCDKAMLNP